MRGSEGGGLEFGIDESPERIGYIVTGFQSSAPWLEQALNFKRVLLVREFVGAGLDLLKEIVERRFRRIVGSEAEVGEQE